MIDVAPRSLDDSARSRSRRSAVGRLLFYARVDLVTSASGPMLMELELIEPSLYFEASPGALARFADGVFQRLG